MPKVTTYDVSTGGVAVGPYVPPLVEVVDPLTVPIPVGIFWLAVEDLLGLTKYGIMAGIMSSSTLSEPEKMDALINLAVRDNYRWEDGNFQKLIVQFGYPAEQAGGLWAYIVEHYDT